MSVKLLSAVWANQDIRRSDHLLLLLALADAASDEGVAWPSVATLAAKTRNSANTARRHLHAVQAAGWVSATERQGSSSLYQLNVERILTPPNLRDHPSQSESPPNLAPLPPVVGPPSHSSGRPPLPTVGVRTVSEPSVNRRATPPPAPKRNPTPSQRNAAAAAVQAHEVDTQADLVAIAAERGIDLRAAGQEVATVHPLPHVGHLVAAWVDGWRESNDGQDPLQAVIRRISGSAKQLSRDLKTRDEWTRAWHSCKAAGKRGAVDLVAFSANQGKRSPNQRGNHYGELAAELERAGL